MSIICITFVKHNHMTEGATVGGRRALSFWRNGGRSAAEPPQMAVR